MLRPYILWIEFILCPLGRIVDDIFADIMHFDFVLNDMLMIIALPKQIARSVTLKVNQARARGLERTDDSAQ